MVDACRLHASIEDDGRGFEVGDADGAGYGLRFMRERAEELGGSLELLSRPGAGTRVVLEVPVAGTSTSRAMPGELVTAGGASR